MIFYPTVDDETTVINEAASIEDLAEDRSPVGDDRLALADHVKNDSDICTPADFISMIQAGGEQGPFENSPKQVQRHSISSCTSLHETTAVSCVSPSRKFLTIFFCGTIAGDT